MLFFERLNIRVANELETLNKSISITGNSKAQSDLLYGFCFLNVCCSNKREKDALELVDDTKNLFINLSKQPLSDQVWFFLWFRSALDNENSC